MPLTPNVVTTPKLRTIALEYVRELCLLPRETGTPGLLGLCEFQISLSGVVEGHSVPSAAPVPETDLIVRLVSALTSASADVWVTLLTRRTLTFGGFESDSVSFQALSSSCLWLSLNRMFCVVSERRPHPFPFAMSIMDFHLKE